MNPPAEARLIGREFVILSVAAMLFFLCMGGANPLLPKFVVDDLGESKSVAGLVVGSIAVSSLLFRGYFGRLGGRRGSRLLVMLGCGSGAVGMFVMALAVNVPIAIMGRFFTGLGQAALMTGAMSLAIDIAPTHRRGEAASYMMVAYHLGLGLGPVMAEAVLRASSFGVVFVSMAGAMIAGIGAGWLLPDRGGHPDAPPAPLFNRDGVAAGWVTFFGIIPFVAFNFLVPLYGKDELGLEEVGLVFTVASVCIALSRVLLSRLPDRIGPIKSGAIALYITLVGAVVVPLWHSVVGVYVGSGLMAFGMAILSPALMPAVIEGVEEHRRASAIATFTMFVDVSVAFTGPVFGALATGLGYRASFAIGASTCLIAIAVHFGLLNPRWQRQLAARAA